MDSLIIREFQQAITNFINKSPLPREIKRLAIGELYSNICQATEQEIIKQIADREEAEQKQEADDGQTVQ